MSGVVFDLDGTLADSLADIAGALNYVLAELDQPTHTQEQVLDWIGWGVRHLIEHAAADPSTVDDAVARFRTRYAEHLIVKTTPYPGVPELLDGLVADGAPLAVLSNKPHAMTVRIVDQLFARWSFVDARGHRPPTPRKPDPTAALEIATAIGAPPAELVFVGDTAVDIETALAAGMTAVGVSWGFRTPGSLREAGANIVVDTPAELLDWLRAR